MRLLVLLLLCSIFTLSNTKRTFEVDFENNCFLKDGEPYRYISGTIHYFRVPAKYWEDRLMKLRALGCNAVQTYVMWFWHEPVQGHFTFSGESCIKLHPPFEATLYVRRVGEHHALFGDSAATGTGRDLAYWPLQRRRTRYGRFSGLDTQAARDPIPQRRSALHATGENVVGHAIAHHQAVSVHKRRTHYHGASRKRIRQLGSVRQELHRMALVCFLCLLMFQRSMVLRHV
jgi:hypothetical protein